MSGNKKVKLLYVENLRIILSALVIAVHAACTYGGPGGWSYTEPGAGLLSVIPLTVFNATSQSFFMGMFFFFGAYFTHRSFQKKGLVRFTKDRFFRLVIPLLLTWFFISPLTRYIVLPIRHPDAKMLSFAEEWMSGKGFGHGVMWFAEILILFTILYIIAYYLIPQLRIKERLPLPVIKSRHILIVSILLGLGTFFARIAFPLFRTFFSIHYNLGHFPQYILLFALGVAASRYSSEYLLSYKQAKRWMWFSLIMIFAVFPLIFVTGKAYEGDLRPFLGGFTWQSLAFSVWEQVTGIAIIVTLLGTFRSKWNFQSKMASRLSGSAYAVYVFHPPILVAISVVLANWEAMHLVKFFVVTPLAIIASFAIAILVKQLPIMRRIF